MVKQAQQGTKVLTPEFRVSFPHVFEPNGYDGGPEKFSLVMIFDKKQDISALKQAAFNAAVAKWGSDKAKWPKNLKLPFRDGSEKSDLKGYGPNTVFVSASSQQRPGVCDQRKATITEEDGRFYPGCYARATLNAFAYDRSGNRGISFGLNNVQLIRDGERFDGRSSVDDDFEELEDASENPASYARADLSGGSMDDAFV